MTNENPDTLTADTPESPASETPAAPEKPKVNKSIKVYDFTKPLTAVVVPLLIIFLLWMSTDELQSVLTRPLSDPWVIWDLAWLILAAGFIIEAISEAIRVFTKKNGVAKWTKFGSNIFYFGAAFVATTSFITLLPVLSGILYTIAGIWLVLYLAKACFGKRFVTLDSGEYCECDCEECKDCEDCEDCACNDGDESGYQPISKISTTTIIWTFGNKKDK